MKILVPLLIKPDGPDAWRENAKRIEGSLTYEDKEVVYYDEEVPRYQSTYAGEANARNGALDKFLKDEHSHVFWIDTDIVQNDDNIIEKLLELSTKDVVAPYVFIEDNEKWEFKRFYDLDGFIDKNDDHFNYVEPYISYGHGEILQEVKSVGACYIIPADVYKKGLRYDPYNTKKKGVEHMTLFDQMRDMCKIYATPTIEVRHAFLPKYGVDFR